MKLQLLLIAATSAFCQSYGTYSNPANGAPVARTSFLKSQLTSGNALRDPSLLLYWPLTATGGDMVSNSTDLSFLDYSGNGITGTYGGGQSNGWYPGKISNYAPYFNEARGNYVQAAVTIPAGPFTVSAWAKPATGYTGGYVRIAEVVFSSSFYLGTDSTMGYWQLIINDSSLTHACKGSSSAGGAVNAGTWQLVTGVWDGTYGYLYVNGSLVIGGSAAGSACQFTAPASITHALRVGCGSNGAGCSGNSAFNGAIQDFRIYTRALSAAEVLAIYSAENH
jgi:hypothetical protein